MAKKRMVGLFSAVLFGLYPGLLLAVNAHRYLSGARELMLDPKLLWNTVQSEPNPKYFFLFYLVILLTFLCWSLVKSMTLNYKSGLQQVAPGIQTPIPCGQNQYGSARWLKKPEYSKRYLAVRLHQKNNIVQWLVRTGKADLSDEYDQKQDISRNCRLFSSGGIAIGQTQNGRTLYVIKEDTHSLVIGATRSSKSRSVVLPSICVSALAEESMVLSDPKGELFFYTAPFLRRLGYEVIVLDFESPKKSVRYNFMQPIIDWLKEGNISAAKMSTNELVEGLVGKNKHSGGESIWTEGEKSIMACCIMAVAYDNQTSPQYQNLTNVYHFISNMCTAQDGTELPLLRYLDSLSDDHPAKSLAGISNVAHVRTRSSFYASALATLRLFEDYNIADMTSATEFDVNTTGIIKRAIFIILPDETDVYYPVASLFVYQHYQALVRTAKKHGGRLPRRVEFFLDEIGNFTHIPNFEKLLTVGGGRGIRFHLFLQSLMQLEETYNKNVAHIIHSNCETWVYLKANDLETQEEVSNRLGKYTIKTPSLTASLHGGGGSASYNYTGRNLLTVEDIQKIERPYQLVMSGTHPALLYAPDISRTSFNDMLGLGNKEHNQSLIIHRNNVRPERVVQFPQLWGIWTNYEKAKAKPTPVYKHPTTKTLSNIKF